MNENEICTLILDAAFKIHKELGPGLFESAYKECMIFELEKSNLFVVREKPIPMIYQDIKLDIGNRVDIEVEKKVIVEIKSVEAIHDIHKKQLLTYLKLSGCKLGVLINFNVAQLKEGIKRVANNL